MIIAFDILTYKRIFFKHKRNEVFFYILFDNLGSKFYFSVIDDGIFIVLRREHNSMYSVGISVVIILDSYLTFRVRTQIGHHFLFTTDRGEFHKQDMTESNGKRHEIFRFVCCITKHHTLVSRALIFGTFTLNTLIDIVRLLVDSRQYSARITIEFILGLGIPDTINYFTSNRLHVNIGFTFYFSTKHYLTCGNKSFTRYLRRRIISHIFVENSVTDLVGYFIRMSLRYRLRCK